MKINYALSDLKKKTLDIGSIGNEVVFKIPSAMDSDWYMCTYMSAYRDLKLKYFCCATNLRTGNSYMLHEDTEVTDIHEAEINIGNRV